MGALVLPVMTGGVIVYLRRSGRLSRILCIVLLLGTAAAALLLLQEAAQPEGQRITELSRSEAGLLDEPVPLEVEMEGEEREQVSIRIPEKELSSAETQELLAAKAAELEKEILGENRSLTMIDRDLHLPTSFSNSAITAVWSSDRPDILNWQGVIGSAAEPEGSPVKLTATLSLGEESLLFRRELTVYPSRETAAIERRLQETGDAMNADTDGEAYRLPAELDGKSLTWYRRQENMGRNLCLLLLLAAVLLTVSRSQREEDLRQKRQEALRRSYPELLSKTQLLLAAGLSLRRAMERLASDFRREKKRTGKPDPCGEEVLRTWYELENGVPEQDALQHLGERCGLPEYKSFSLLLAQNQKKGGHRLPQILETEVQEAYEERRRQARVAGEKAAVRLALPMGMMLVVVLVIVMVPAVLTF